MDNMSIVLSLSYFFSVMSTKADAFRQKISDFLPGLVEIGGIAISPRSLTWSICPASWARRRAKSGVSPGFGGLTADIDLDQNVLDNAKFFSARRSMSPSSSSPSTGLDQVHLAHHILHLVALQVADEVDLGPS